MSHEAPSVRRMIGTKAVPAAESAQRNIGMKVIATQADQPAGSMQAIGTLGQAAGTVDNAAAK